MSRLSSEFLYTVGRNLLLNQILGVPFDKIAKHEINCDLL